VLGPLNSLVWYVPSLRYTRGLGWRMHCGAEVTESSTNKQHLSGRVLLIVVRAAPWGPWLRRGVPGRSRLHAAGCHSSGCRRSVQMRHCQMESRICSRGYDCRRQCRQSCACHCIEDHEQQERHPDGQTCCCGRIQNQEGRRRHHCR
jgi:hypothetical protein